MCCN
jgi:U3 small nucleolar RNA-associated protein 25